MNREVLPTASHVCFVQHQRNSWRRRLPESCTTFAPAWSALQPARSLPGLILSRPMRTRRCVYGIRSDRNLISETRRTQITVERFPV